MQNFNLHRLCRVVRYDVRSERSFFLKAFAWMFAINVFMMIVSVYSSESAAMTNKMIAFNFVVYIYTFVCFGASIIFRNMKGKPARMAYLMIPASNMEKFISRIIVMLVLWVFVYISAFVVVNLGCVVIGMALGNDRFASLGSDVFRMAYSYGMLMSDPKIAAIGVNDVFSVGKSVGISAWLVHTKFISAGCFVSMIFKSISGLSAALLCGTLFRHYGWFYALLLNILLSLGKILNPGVLTFQILLSVMSVLLSVVCIYTSYKLFCRRQVIGKSLLNI